MVSIANDRQLQPSIPISYNETLLKCLHGKPQVKILTNVSMPLPIVSESEDCTDEEAGRNTLLGTVHYRTAKFSLVKTILIHNKSTQLHKSLSSIKHTLQDHYNHNFVLGITNITRPLSMHSHNSCFTRPS